MKKNLLSIVLLSLAISSFGQIVINNGDIAPVGTTVYMGNDTVPGSEIIPGEAGADKTWDFTSVMAHSTDTMDLVSPVATPYAGEFPASNFAITNLSQQDTTNFFFYMTRNDDKMASVGYVGESGEDVFIWHIDPENIMLDFPVTYQNSYSENYTVEAVISSPQPGADSVRLKNIVSKQTEVDAWGTLSIPMGTFDVLRQREDEVTTDSIFVLIGGNWLFISAVQDSTTYYSWWTNDVSIGFQLFTIDVDKANGDITNVSYMVGSTVDVAEHILIDSRAYPNPVSEVLNIEFEEAQTGQLVLFNQLGQMVLQKEINKQNRVQLKVSQLPAGIYLYNLNNSAGENIGSGKVMKK